MVSANEMAELHNHEWKNLLLKKKLSGSRFGLHSPSFNSEWHSSLIRKGNTDKVLSKENCTRDGQKRLGVVLAPAKAVVVLDDTLDAWKRHKDNLVMKKYQYFSTASHVVNIETMEDESETEGELARVLQKLKKVHHMFFNPEIEVDSQRFDVKQVLKKVQNEASEDSR
ncbi:Rna polymerase ii c-terminal domain phosphatase-like [Thalictrum thalictroides]|uniref:protein-serine/threonine phosphatase n=1 Tax=Thalictrum thalictroides TaxID=46969 RepID=A0A7J6WY75_THATH|nr:Rna polymerase ii c-terminal domain phosphatase-like [Thalictrum thalictroides]